MKTEDKILIAIRSRKDLEPVKISLRKLLASGNIEHYLNLCSDRLAENEMIDGEDTQINFADFPDILFTMHGFFECRHVLENYLPFDTLADTWQLLIKVEQENKEINRMASDFRKMKFRELLELYKDQRLREAAASGQMVRNWIVCEAWNRSIFAWAKRKVNSAIIRLIVRAKYHKMFSFLREYANGACEE